MIDPESKKNLINSISPTAIEDKMEIVNLISGTYINETLAKIFDLKLDDELIKYDTSRLALSSSILDDSSINGFLIAECEDILWEIKGFNALPSLSNLVSLTEIGYYYFLSNYDANASVIAKKILILLEKTYALSVEINKYFRSYSYFLQGNFNQIIPSSKIIRKKDIQDDMFSFLTDCLFDLAKLYKNEIEEPDYELLEKINLLETILAKQNNYWYISTEINHIKIFYSKLNEKALIPILSKIKNLPSGYIKTINFPFLWPSTKEFIEKYFFNQSSHAVINTPTGSGKSFLAELAIASNLENGWVLYLAPTNALCSQISKTLKNNLKTLAQKEIQVVFGYEEYTKQKNRDNKILVTTPEKALIFLKLDAKAFENCNLLIFDECHLINDENRGVTAEIVVSLLLQMNNNLKTIFMSAMIDNPDDLSKWLFEISSKRVSIINSEWKPTRVARFLVSIDFDTKENIAENRFSVNLSSHTDTESPWNQKTKTLINYTLPLKLVGKNIIRNERVVNDIPFVNEASRLIAQKLSEKNYRTMVFVVRDKAHVFSIAEKWENVIKNDYLFDDYELALKQIIEFELGTDSLPVKLLIDKKVAVYSSALLESEQRICQYAFSNKDKDIKTLIATGTLSQGMNLKIDSVVIAGTTRFDNNISQDLIHEILNAMGRASRANYAIHGLSFIVPTSKISNKLHKNELVEVSNCIEKKDSSTAIFSNLTKIVTDISQIEIIEKTEESFVSALPINNILINSVINQSFGTYNLDDELKKKTNKVIGNYFVNIIDKYKIPKWVLEATSIVNLPPLEGVWLYKYILEKSIALKPISNYVDWVFYLIDYICYVKTDLCKDILDESYKFRLGEKLKYRTDKSARSLLCDEIKRTVELWINGGNYIEIASSFNFSITERNISKRSSTQFHPIPKVFKWKKIIPSKLSRLGSLLLAIQDYWIKNSPETLPSLLLDNKSLNSISLGIKFGLSSPEALACYENIIGERKASIYLSNLYINSVNSPFDWEERYKYSERQKRLLLKEKDNNSNSYFQSIINIFN